MENTLSQLSDMIYAFGNDVHLLHFHTVGENFLEYHEILNELYDICFDMYDAISEQAIAEGEVIDNPSLASERADWKPLELKEYTVEDILDYMQTKGEFVLSEIANIKEYPSYIQSIVDSYTEDLATIIKYKLNQSAK